MTDQIAATSINCRQCAAPLTVEQGQPFVTCRFCGATNFVDKSRVVLHYLVKPTVREDGAREDLNRWMAGNATVKDLDRKAKVDSVAFQYFPMWLVRTTVQQNERVFLKPAAALSVSELGQLNIPPSDLVPFDAHVDGAIVSPTVPFETMQQWLIDDQHIAAEHITEAALVHVPVYVCKYVYNNRRFTALVDAASSKVFANIYPAKWEVPYVSIGAAAFVAFFILSLLSLANFGLFLIGAPIMAILFFSLAVSISAKV
ncbi:MAG TPA: hypothetical protein VMP08_22375 [Anaerolineae bacterium]|nr:hypothetical protein [Anaerolineae bacterium]